MKYNIWDLIRMGKEKNCSDLHIISGLSPKCRIDGEITSLDDTVLSAEDCSAYAEMLVGEDYASVAEAGEWDGATEVDGTRCRINIFHQRNGISIAIRLLRNEIPKLEELALPPVVSELPALKTGIVLVTGVTGSGKSTTLAAILDTINHTRRAHILTLEDPVEYVYTPDLCIINQREVGRDTESYASGLHTSLREDPDVILIGEMRDLDTIRIALTAAETGHLVFATLHSGSAADAVDRIVDVFPEGEKRQVRIQLAASLQAVVSQKLLPKIAGGRVAACEIMMATPAIRNLIREGKSAQIASSILTSAAEGSITMDASLVKLAKERIISAQVARENAADVDFVKKHALF
nr:PilT/PilU family type 4a pilus ATPase [uncultured Anaerotignum sp.]